MQLISSGSRAKKRAFKLASYGLGTIFLGALGSGLWERVLSPTLGPAARAVLSIIASVSKTYRDSLYKNIGVGTGELLSKLPFTFLLVGLVIVPWFLIIFIFRLLHKIEGFASGKPAETEPSKDLRRIRNLTYRLLVPMSIVTSLGYIHIGLRDTYTRNACVYVERSIDILAPVIGPERTVSLRAKYRSVETAEAFYSLDAELKELAVRSKTKLPSFKPI